MNFKLNTKYRILIFMMILRHKQAYAENILQLMRQEFSGHKGPNSANTVSQEKVFERHFDAIIQQDGFTGIWTTRLTLM